MNKRYLKTLFLTLATLAPLTLLPGGAQAAEEYVLPDGGTLSIDEHGTCTAVTNNSGNDLMVPTKDRKSTRLNSSHSSKSRMPSSA